MEERYRKAKNSDIAPPPPVLLRRRLSAPETIMRKHTLAQQRSSSQESDRSRNSSSTHSCNLPLGAGSDPNLRKRDTDIRKSTLIKRFYEHSKALQFPRTYSEWQYSFGKMKLSSNHSTPEHIRSSRRSVYELASKHRKPSQEFVQLNSPKRRISVTNGNSDTAPSSNKIETNGNYEESENSYVVYSSNFSNLTSSESTAETSRVEERSVATNFDSALSNTYSSAAPPSSDATAEISKLPIKYQFVMRDSNSARSFENENTNESATQTGETTNLNVITNVQLSQSTLNLIFNQVMQDILHLKTNSDQEPKESKLINVETLPTFNLKHNENGDDKMISEVNAGSPYKNKLIPLVPRLSAVPRSTSMEVNISSNDSFDKESESSLADSLEDSTSHKDNKHDHDEKMVRGQLALLPDNSNTTKSDSGKKSSAFYIPIEEEIKTVIEENKGSNVSSLLPAKLREKLQRRQMKREEKIKGNHMQSFERLDISNDNIHPYFNTTPDSIKKAKNKITLPTIENRKEIRHSRTRENHEAIPVKPKSFWLPKTKQSKKLSPLPIKNNTEANQQKPDTPKQIEILEIMEIVEPQKPAKAKSRIPVLVNHKLPKIHSHRSEKPTLLNFEVEPNEQKLDQLIANILIDSLNREDLSVNQSYTQTDNVQTPLERNNNPNMVDTAADILTKQVLENNNLTAQSTEKDKSNSNFPKGWITFYMLQKNNSAESTSDEGSKTVTSKIPKAMTTKRTKTRTNESFKDSDYKSEDFNDTDETDSEEEQKVQGKNGGWSVTVTGTSDGQPVPDVEMRLRFPHLPEPRARNKRQSDARFPHLSHRGVRHRESGFSYEEICCNRRPSEINKSKRYLKHCETLNHNPVFPSKYEPRPTKTSTRRSLLHRPPNRLREIIVPLEESPRKLEDILGKFPEILAVSGNGVRKDNRIKLPRMNERELKRFLSQLNDTNE